MWSQNTSGLYELCFRLDDSSSSKSNGRQVCASRCLQVSGNQGGSSPYQLVLMKVNDKCAVSPRVIMRCPCRGLLPDVCLWENGPGPSFDCGQVPHLCCPAHSTQAWSQGCFRVCSLHWPTLSHSEEGKLIVSLLNLIPHRLLKGFTACQALRQVLGNEIK